MATTTTNMGLVKPLTTELADIGVINANMDKVDGHRHLGGSDGQAVRAVQSVPTGTALPAAGTLGQVCVLQGATGQPAALWVDSGSTVGWIQVQNVSGGSQTVSTKSTSYTAASTDGCLLCDASLGGFTITLPTAVGSSGKVFNVKKIDSSANVVTIAAATGQTIDGQSTRAIASPYDSYTVLSDGSNWWIV